MKCFWSHEERTTKKISKRHKTMAIKNQQHILLKGQTCLHDFRKEVPRMCEIIDTNIVSRWYQMRNDSLTSVSHFFSSFAFLFHYSRFIIARRYSKEDCLVPINDICTAIQLWRINELSSLLASENSSLHFVPALDGDDFILLHS